MNERTMVVQLQNDGTGPTLPERMRQAIGATAGIVTLKTIAVVIEVTPINPTIPSPVAWRVALKRLRRQAGLKACWAKPPARPARKPASKPTSGRRKAKTPQRSSGAGS